MLDEPSTRSALKPALTRSEGKLEISGLRSYLFTSVH